MNVIRAETLGLCFGVRDALTIAARVERPAEVTIHGDLVHNEAVLVQLDARGFHRSTEQNRGSLPETKRVLITAHGISDAARRRFESGGKDLIDTTCPLVRRAHRAAQTLAVEGYHVLVIGRPGHVEVQGIVEDLSVYDMIAGTDDVQRYASDKLGVICQTTTPPRTVEPILAAIRERNPNAEVRLVDTICQPTRDRQQAVEKLLVTVDAMVVVGGSRSNNTRELVALCREQGVPAYHVQSAAELVASWFENCANVGLTAGTSTLDETIEEVHAALLRL